MCLKDTVGQEQRDNHFSLAWGYGKIKAQLLLSKVVGGLAPKNCLFPLCPPPQWLRWFQVRNAALQVAVSQAEGEGGSYRAGPLGWDVCMLLWVVVVEFEMAKKKSHSSIPLSKLSGKDWSNTRVAVMWHLPSGATLLTKIDDMLNSLGGNRRLEEFTCYKGKITSWTTYNKGG